MLKVIELFSGIGAQTQALKNINLPAQTVAISEIDKYCLDSYYKLHGKVLNLGDITKINLKDVPDCDLLTYSFPCQDISSQGLQRGLDVDSKTRSSLLWEVERIVEAKRPQYLLMENVKNLVNKTHFANFKNWINKLNTLGYTSSWTILNAVNFDVPQNRERVFLVSVLHGGSFYFDNGVFTDKTIIDIMETDNSAIPRNMWMDKARFIANIESAPSKTGLLHVGTLDINNSESAKRVYSINSICPTLTTMNGGHTQPKILVGDRVRKLTPKECWRLMGFEDEQFDKVKRLSNAQLYKQAGNSIVVPCLESIFAKMFIERLDKK